MAGWDVGLIDPVGVVEREESCLMDVVEVLVEIGREQHGVLISNATDSERKELMTISEGMDSDDDSTTSISTLRPIHHRADAILSRMLSLNPSLRPLSPSNTTISRATQTSPPPPQFTTPRTRRKHKLLKRTPRLSRRKFENSVQTDNDTESGIPSSIPLSYSSDSSPSQYPLPRIHKSKISTPLRNSSTSHLFAPVHLRSPVRSRSHSSSSESHFRIDSPYTAALRRRRQLAIESLRRSNHSTSHKDSRRKSQRRIRVFSVGRDVADSTFAEDSDTSPRRLPSRRRLSPRKQRRSKLVSDPESTTDGLTDLERRVQALRIWGGIEEERKEWLMNEIKKKDDMSLMERNVSLSGEMYSRSHSQSSGLDDREAYSISQGIHLIQP